VVGVLGLVALALAYLYRPDMLAFVLTSTLALQGIVFFWAFVRRDTWWAVIPGVGLFSLALICLTYCLIVGSIVWLGVLILGLGAYVIAVIPNDKVWVNVFYVLGLLLVLFAIYLSPIIQLWQVILVAVFLLLLVLTLWLDREDLGRLWD
jgi:hypothetical protein